MTKLTDATRASLRSRSRLVHLGRNSEQSQGFINVPPFRGSTVLYPDVATLKSRAQRYTYGTHGTPTTDALCAAWTDIAGAAGTVLVPSGLAAIVVALMTALGAGDHLTDHRLRLPRQPETSPTRRSSVWESRRPTMTLIIGAGIGALMRPNTKAVLTELPGSQTFEIQDVPAIAEVAHAHGACVLMDNTWATPLFFPPHAHGVDMAIEAGTKYLSGHSDLLLGLVSANAAWFDRLHRTTDQMAIPPGPEDVFLALRGLRSMELAPREAERQGLALAQWLSTRPEVLRVMHPALPDHPGHALMEARFLRLVRPLQHRPETRSGSGGRGVPGWARALRPRLFLGRLREPRRSVRLHVLPHRDPLGAGRSCHPFQRRPRGHRGFEGRSRQGFRATDGDGVRPRPSRRPLARAPQEEDYGSASKPLMHLAVAPGCVRHF